MRRISRGERVANRRRRHLACYADGSTPSIVARRALGAPVADRDQAPVRQQRIDATANLVGDFIIDGKSRPLKPLYLTPSLS
jgi:hypothetical protein